MHIHMYMIRNHVCNTQKLHNSVCKYGGKTKFGPEKEELTKVVDSTTWLGGLAARAFDLRLNGREFNSQAALLSSDSGQVIHTYLA